MKLIEATILGKKSFTNSKSGQTYNVVNLTFKTDDVEGADIASVFVDSLKPYEIGQKVKIGRIGKYVNIIES